MAKYLGPPLRDAFCELLGTTLTDERIGAAVIAYRERFEAVGMFENAVYEGIPDALADLMNNGAVLYVATSKPRVYARQILEHFGLAKCFAAVHGSELGGALSNKGELIAHVLATEGLSPGNTTMVGDRHHDIAGAKEVGVHPVGVLWGYGTREELADAGAKGLVERPHELARLVD